MGEEQTVAAVVRKEFEQAGFEIEEVATSPEAFEVKKYNCTQLLERKANGAWVPSGSASFNVRGLKCQLEDRGYQKFWHFQGKRFPIRVTDLKSLHRFDQEVRTVLGLKSLYHESLGTTCAQSAYDRLDRRLNK